jgi:hypothetical protein
LFRLATVTLQKSWYMMMTRKVRAYQEKAHSEVGGEEGGMAFNLRNAWGSAPSSGRAAPIHTPTRCGPRGDSVNESCLQERKDWSQTFPVYTESFY